jgi:hypothetical protein
VSKEKEEGRGGQGGVSGIETAREVPLLIVLGPGAEDGEE